MHPRPTTLPSMTSTSVCKAKCANKTSTEGLQYTSAVTWSFLSHRAKRLTRLSGWAPAGTCAATGGSWVLLLATMPLISAARVATCRAMRPLGSLGYPCIKAARMARSWRRLSLLVCSFYSVALSTESIR
jgi:hypothetical protein